MDMEGWLTRGGRVFAEKFKLVVCGFGLEGEVVDIEEEEGEGNRKKVVRIIYTYGRLYMFLLDIRIHN